MYFWCTALLAFHPSGSTPSCRAYLRLSALYLALPRQHGLLMWRGTASGRLSRAGALCAQCVQRTVIERCEERMWRSQSAARVKVRMAQAGSLAIKGHSQTLRLLEVPSTCRRRWTFVGGGGVVLCGRESCLASSFSSS